MLSLTPELCSTVASILLPLLAGFGLVAHVVRASRSTPWGETYSEWERPRFMASFSGKTTKLTASEAARYESVNVGLSPAEPDRVHRAIYESTDMRPLERLIWPPERCHLKPWYRRTRSGQGR